MKKAKLFISILIMSILVLTQVIMVSAAPSFDEAVSVSGSVQAITLETDLNTGVTTLLVTIEDDLDETQTIRISEQTAYDIGLVDYDDDGNPFIIEPLPEYIEIAPATVIPGEEEIQHPVASALATFFSDIPGLEYEVIMSAYEAGNGFGVIAQALWLTRKLEGDSVDFITIIEAKKSGDFSDIILEDGTSPLNWGQFRKAVLDQKDNPGVVISNRDRDNGNAGNNGNINNNGNGNNNNKNKDKDKKNNGNGNPNKP